MSSPPRRVLRVALDWTPNTNHVGFFIAAERGWYGEAGLDVQLLSPHVDGYKTTPAAHLANGSADLACVPSESVISAATWPTSHGVREKPALVAVAALLQQDASAVVALQSSGITRPRELDGKRYASYAARYEGRLVQSLIRADGGSGSFIELTPPMLDIWPMLLAGQADATWVFMPWEGVAAARAGHSLNVFRMADAGIPYCYSPVLAATRETLDRDGDAVRALLAATARGYQTAAADPAAGAAALLSAAAAMQPALSPPLDAGVVSDSMVQLSGLLLDKQGRWGCMAETCWDAFLDWLSAQGLLTTRAPSRAARPGDGGPLATLDELRAGGSGGGDPVPRDTVVAAVLMTNAYLPP